MKLIKQLTFSKPILTGVVLMLIALVFRLVDIFVLRLDELWGEIILSKALGFCLVLLFLYLIGKKPTAIGLGISHFGRGLCIGAILALLPYVFSYAIEWFVLTQAGEKPGLLLAGIDPKAGVSGGVLFGLWLVAGNFINAFMEEGLFRGVMLKLFRIRLPFLQANGLQALLFGAWHLVWVVKWYQTGSITTPGEISGAFVTNFLPQLLMGLVWGYAFLKTGNLWIPWTAHMITNTVLNLVHISSISGMDEGMTIRMLSFIIISFLMLFVVKAASKRWDLKEMTPLEPAQ